ncbi:hypothetical protein DSO57_1021872 [Entomophthora muscae]|uniref:Uncharacterized protein n=1 Tax=Entomophthora muscae TaxID=34485 RepID=A0ACC2TQL7_9FUNG|nr:hypothetical protein DSO57_1021872 [Entomophthora muscae]
MIIKRPQLWESNPDAPRAASPQGQPPSRPQFLGFKLESDLTSENLLKFDEPKVPVNPTSQRAGLATDPRITWATAEEETKIPSIRSGPPRDDPSCDLVKELECSSCKPANEITPKTVATKSCEDLVDGETRAMKIFESFAMTDGHTYTLGRQEDAHCHPCNKSTPCGSAPRVHLPQETTDQPPELYRPPGAPFSPVHFTEYPPNLVYSEFTLEEILIHDPEARTRETEAIYREGIKITIPPLLFQDKYNFLPAYLVPMTPPLTPRPNCPQGSIATDESTSTKIFGVMYITLTGLIDFMVPTSRPWAILGKFPNPVVDSPCWARGPSARKSSGTPQRLDPGQSLNLVIIQANSLIVPLFTELNGSNAMANCQKRNKKPVVCYTDVSKLRINQAQKGIPKISVTTTHNYSPILALDEDEFTEILGGKIDTAFCSSPSMASYQPSISPSKSGTQDSGMPKSTQLSTIAKKRSRGSRSKATSIAPTDKVEEQTPTLIKLLTTLNKNKMSNNPLIV